MPATPLIPHLKNKKQSELRKPGNYGARLLFFFVISLICSPVFAENKNPSLQLPEEMELIDFKHSQNVNEFIDYMVDRHGFTQDQLESVFSQVHFNAKTWQLIKPAAITTSKNWAAYRERVIKPLRIKIGVAFWDNYEKALQRAEQQFGIPAQIIVGIIGIETTFGKNVGKFSVVDALATLAFTYPETPNKAARMAYFRGELEHVLLFARESGINPFSLYGSYAGAIGWPQFMPSSIRQFAVDFNGDGKIDLRNSPVDAIGSVANFLSHHGWEADLPLVFPAKIISQHPETKLTQGLNATYTLEQLAEVAVPTEKNMPEHLYYGLIDLQNGEKATKYWFATQNFFAITKYNRSYFYAMSVIELGKAIDAVRHFR